MRQFKVLTVVGARPQFVKAAALSPALRRRGGVAEVLVHTGQHFDANMSDVFFDELGIPRPQHNLGIGGGSHGQNTGRMIEALEATVLTERPDVVLVYGDTDSTLAAAIATSKLGVALVHVEAGLRSYRRAMPEEINRVVADHLADVLYAPSPVAVGNLATEGVAADKIVMVGDVMQDVVRVFTGAARGRSSIIGRLGLQAKQYALLTLHRKENTDDPTALARILDGLAQVATPILFPIHPRTSRRLAEFGLALPPNVHTVEPTGYLDTLILEAESRMILTDSGGVQKEAYFHGVPCVTLRDETEWKELVETGANVLVGTDPTRLAQCSSDLGWFKLRAGIYGDGRAADAIAADLKQRFAR